MDTVDNSCSEVFFRPDPGLKEQILKESLKCFMKG